MLDILKNIIYERNFCSSFLTCLKRLLDDGNYSSSLKFQITQRLYAHHVVSVATSDLALFLMGIDLGSFIKRMRLIFASVDQTLIVRS